MYFDVKSFDVFCCSKFFSNRCYLLSSSPRSPRNFQAVLRFGFSLSFLFFSFLFDLCSFRAKGNSFFLGWGLLTPSSFAQKQKQKSILFSFRIALSKEFVLVEEVIFLKWKVSLELCFTWQSDWNLHQFSSNNKHSLGEFNFFFLHLYPWFSLYFSKKYVSFF